MIICFKHFGQVAAEKPENLPVLTAAEFLMALKKRADFHLIEREAEEEEAYERGKEKP